MADTRARLNEFRPESFYPEFGSVIDALAEIRVPHDGESADLGVGALGLAFYDAAGRLTRLISFDAASFSSYGDGFGYSGASVRSTDDDGAPAVAVALIEGASIDDIDAGGGAVVEFLTAGTPVEAVDGPAAGETPVPPLDPAGAAALPDAAAGLFSTIQRLESGAWEVFDNDRTFFSANTEAGLRLRVSDVVEGPAGETTPMTVVVTRLGSAVEEPGTITLSVSDGTSFAGDDYDPDSLISGLAFTLGQRTRTTTLDVFGDDRPEADETLTVAAFDGVGGFSAFDVATILNDDGPITAIPRLNEFQPGVAEGASGRIELRAPWGLNLSGPEGNWRIGLYDADTGNLLRVFQAGRDFFSDFGNRDAVYEYHTLSVSDASAFAQGRPAGVALIAPDGAVVEFIATATAFEAANGPAAGATAEPPLDALDAPALPDDETPTFISTQRLEDGSWEIFDSAFSFGFSTFSFANETAGLRVRGGAVDEGGPGETAALPFTITRLGDVSTAATFMLSLVRADGEFGVRGDYDPGSLPDEVAFAAGEREKVVTVTAAGDDRPEPDVALTLQVYGDAGGSAQSTGTIRNDDGPIVETPRVNEILPGFDDPSVGSFSGGIEIRTPKGVRFTDPSTGADLGWRIALYTEDGSAGGVFIPGEVFFGFTVDDTHNYYHFFRDLGDTPLGRGEPVGVAVIDPAGVVVDFVSTGAAFIASDGLADGATAEALRGPDGAPLDAPDRFGAFQRFDDDVWLTTPRDTLGQPNRGPLIVRGGEVVEPGPGETATLRFTIERIGDASEALEVRIQTEDDSGAAVAFQDYQPLFAEARFEAGETVLEVEIAILGDATPEFDETVALSVLEFRDFRTYSGVGTILDPDGPPEISARINEVRPTGVFVGDFVEIRITANAPVAGYALARYSAAGKVLETFALDDADAFDREGRDAAFDYYVLRENLPDAGGALAFSGPDGLLEFFSWGAPVTASDGPAAGETAVGIVGRDPDGEPTTPVDFNFGSAQRTGDGGWRFAFDQTPGAGNFLNDDGRGVEIRIADVDEPGPGGTVAMTVTLERLGDVSAVEDFRIELAAVVGEFENDFVGFGLALPGADFNPLFPRLVTFEAGQTTLSFDITVFGDDQPEFEEVIPLIVFGDNQFAFAEGAIRDADGPPPVEARFNEIVYAAPGFPFGSAVEVRVTANAPDFNDSGIDGDFYDILIYRADGTVRTRLNLIDDGGFDPLVEARTDGRFDYYVLELPFGTGDALALVDLRSGAVLDFLSIGAPVAATEGAAEGLTATVVADADGAPLTQGVGTPLFTAIERLDDGGWVQRPSESSIGFRTKAPGVSVYAATERFEDETRLLGQLWIGSDTETPGVLEIVGGAVDVETSLWVGDGGLGDLRLSDGAALQLGDPDLAHPDGRVAARIGTNGGTGSAIIEGGATLRVDAPAAYAGTEFRQGGYYTVNIGRNGGEGDVRVSGAGSSLIGAGDASRITVGADGGAGTLTVEDGGFAGSSQFEIGNRGVGRIEVTGAGSTLRLSSEFGLQADPRWAAESGYVRLGRNAGGEGRLVIADGGLVELRNEAGVTQGPRLELGRDAGGEGFATITGEGSTLRIAQDGPLGLGFTTGANARIGTGGFGRMTVSDGGLLEITGEGARLRVGHGRDTAGGVVADARESVLEIGAGGSAILDGGVYDGSRVTVGETLNARGRIVVSGEGARLIARSDSTAPGQYSTGDIDVGVNGGSGALIVENGGYVNARELSVGANARFFEGYGELGGEGYALVRDGGRIALTLSDAAAYQGLRVGFAAGSVGRVVVSGEGSEIVTSGGAARIVVGDRGEGALRIEGGGRVLGFFGEIGREGEGVVEVDGAGSLLRLSDEQGFFADTPGEAAFLRMGRNDGAYGRLAITGGGRVEVTNGPDSDRDLPIVELARNAGSRGVLEVSGADADGNASTLMLTLEGSSTDAFAPESSAYYGPRLRVGRDGEGSARVADGGQIIVLGEDAAVWVGERSGAGGVAAESLLRIESGGRMTVSSGESQSAARVEAGREAGGRGRIEIDGAGSVLTIASANVDDVWDRNPEGGNRTGAALVVGQRGEGALEVTGGGRVVIDGDDDRYPGLFIGRGLDDGSAAAVGSARVAGEGSAIVVLGTGEGAYGSAGLIQVGARAGARGELTIEGGATVTNAATNSVTSVASRSGAEGFVRVADGGVLNAGVGLQVGVRGYEDGRIDAADGGAGVLELDGGRVVARRATVGETGELRGDGVLAADVTLAGGTLAPGFSVGTFTIEGALTATATAEIVLEIDALAEGSADRLIVTGAADIDAAALRFMFGAGDLGEAGDSVTLIEAGSLTLRNIDVAGQLAAFFGGFPDPGPVSLEAFGLSDAVLIADEGARLTATALGAGAGGGGALDFSGAATGAIFTAINGVGAGTGGGLDAFFAFGVSEVTGSDAGDVIALSQTSGVTIRGGDGSDVFTGGDGDDLIEGGAGDDVIRPGLGADRIVLGEGADRVVGTLAELDGDTIVDFAAEDRIGVLGADGALLDAAITVAEGEIRIDVGRNGVIDAVLFTEGAFEGAQDSLTGASPVPAPMLSVQGAGFISQRRAEGAAGAETPFVFEVTRSGDLSQAVTAAWTVAGVGASPANGADFVGGVLPSGSVTIPAGARGATVTVLVSGDGAVEPDEDFTFRLVSAETAAGAPVAIADATTRARIVNDDIAPLVEAGPAATVSIAATVGAVVEGGVLRFTVTRAGDATDAATVSYIVTGGDVNPASPSDVAGGLPLSGTVTLAAGGRTATIAVRTLDDARIEPTETIRVTLTDARVGETPIAIATAAANGLILDNDVAPPPPPPPSRAVVFGDPHLVTLDGVGYSFQAVGEFTLFAATGDAPLEAQIRTAPQPGSDLVSVITAVATRIGGATLMIDALGAAPALVDGAPVALTATSGPLTVGDGQVFFDGAVYTVLYATGEQLRIEALDGFVNVAVFLDEGRAVSGLLGNFDGDAGNEFALRDGTALPGQLDFATLYGAYADSWRVTDETSFFAYADGEGTDAFTDRSFPRAEADASALPPELRAAAEAAARAAGVTDPLLIEFAALDFALTGDPRFTAAASGVEATPETRLRPLDAPAPPATLGVFVDRDLLVEGDEGEAEVVFTIWRGGDASAAIDVAWSLGGTVDADDLAEGTAFSGTASFAPGQTAATVTVAVLGDDLVEPDETLTLSIAIDRDTHPDALIAASTAGVVVETDDFAPAGVSLSAIEPEVAEGNATGGVASFRLTRTGDPGAAVSVLLTIAGAGETPAIGADILGGLRAERIAFAPGEMERIIEVTFVPNLTEEPDKGFSLTLSDPEGAEIDGPDTVLGAILNDDAGDPVIRLTPSADRYIASGATELVVDGGGGADVIVGGSGNDLLFGGAGADLLVGGPGDDILVGGLGGDTLRGGVGADIYVFAAADFTGGGADFVEGFESGVDRLEFSGFDGLGSFDDLDIRPLGPSLLIALPGGGGVVLRDFAGPLTAADVVFAAGPRAPGGSAEAGVVRLGEGAERFITTHDGPLTVFTGAGVDVVVSGSGDDALRAGPGAKVLIGGAGDDQIFAGPSGANLTGGAGADRFIFAAADTPATGLLVDFVEDFASGTDKLVLTGFDGLDADTLSFRSLGADLALELAANRLVVLRGVATADQLDDGDFLFG